MLSSLQVTGQHNFAPIAFVTPVNPPPALVDTFAVGFFVTVACETPACFADVRVAGALPPEVRRGVRACVLCTGLIGGALIRSTGAGGGNTGGRTGGRKLAGVFTAGTR